MKRTINEIQELLKEGNRFIILSESDPKRKPSGGLCRTVLCECSCGKIKVVGVTELLSGATLSCGCRKSEKAKSRIVEYKYGLSNKRECPVCCREVSYKNRRSYYNACYNNKPCASCSQKGHVAWNKGLKKENDSRVKSYSYVLKDKWQVSKTNDSRISWNKGLDISDLRVKSNVEKTRQSLVIAYKNNKITPWNKGKPFLQVSGDKNASKRPEVREKLKQAYLRRFDKDIKRRLFYNVSACSLFDTINEEMNWNGLHALNNDGGEYFIKGVNFTVDFYEPRLNIVIEFYEKHHNRPQNILKDIERQNKIIEQLKCKFYIIKQGEENLWRTTIQKQYWLLAQQDSSEATYVIG